MYIYCTSIDGIPLGFNIKESFCDSIDKEVSLVCLEPQGAYVNTDNLWPSCMNNRGAVPLMLITKFPL